MFPLRQLRILQVILANRSREKADDLAAAMGSGTTVASLQDVNAGGIRMLICSAVLCPASQSAPWF